jgi:hypothetical protein
MSRALDKERKEIEKCLHIPKNNYKPKAKYELVKRFEYSDDGLMHYGPEKPNIRNPLSFNVLLAVYTSGIMFFSGARYWDDNNHKELISTPKKYLNIEDKVVNLEYKELELVMAPYDDKRYPGKVFTTIPVLLPGGVGKAYYFAKIDFQYLEIWLRDLLLIEKGDKPKIRIFPYTDYFHPFSEYDYPRKTMDEKNRIYFGLWSWNKEDYRKIDKFQVMAYDFEQDTMYFIEWPKLTPKSENIIQISYVIGDDDAIYFQVVTDAACSIYRITPLWDEPMESVEYMPMFYEFYPEIKEKEDQAAMAN